MQNNYYFLQHITKKLNDKLQGFTLTECYSQNKNEIVLVFFHQESNSEFFIRALLRPDFCCLSFPGRLHRAKKNSVDIFPEAVDKKVLGFRQFLNERAFLMNLEGEDAILFKMHGNRSNLIYLVRDIPYAIFNSKLQQDLEINLSSFDRPIKQDYENLVENEGNFKKLFPTFGKTVQEYLSQKEYNRLSTEKKWELLKDIVNELENGKFYVLRSYLPEFSLLKFKAVESEYTDPLRAVSDFYIRYLTAKKFLSQKGSAIKLLSREIKKDHSYIQKSREKLRKLETENNYRQWADLIMANMHRIENGVKEVVLENFYKDNESISITLNPELSPQKNAERYYQKAKNQHKEISNLKEGIEKRENTLIEREIKLSEIEDAEELDDLQKEELPVKKKQEKQEGTLPYYHFLINDYDVYVGKGAKQNDLILQKYSKKDDLWLHARNTPGSHVIIRQKGKLQIPAPVIEKAAQLAAFNSKRKTDSLCPVIVTERKYVRKRKGDPPGAVVVEREEVIMVEPKMWSEYLNV